MAAFRKIRVQRTHEEGVLEITLNGPKGNILDIAMISELTEACESIRNDSGIKAILFQAEGPHFSFGASIPEHKKESVGDLLSRFHEFFRTLIEISLPCIAVVQGKCLGGGLELAGFCQWIFAAEDAEFGQPEINLAVFPPVASLILPHRIGQSFADDLILSGKSITAVEGKKMGLVKAISSNPRKSAGEFIQTCLLSKSRAALRYAVKSVRFEMHTAFLKHITEVEQMYVRELMSTHDANEGVEAFLEKRSPEWRNH